MKVCEVCGASHSLLDPTFRRPEDFVRLREDLRETHARADDDLCSIALPNSEPRFFVRGLLPVSVEGLEAGVCWGLWAEISESSLERILELSQDPSQSDEPPIAGLLANAVPSYPETRGIPVTVQLTGPETRPDFAFSGDSEHPFVIECRGGVTAHRASEWNELIQKRSLTS